MFFRIYQILWLILIPGGANIAANFAKTIFPKFNQPIDFNKSFLGRRITGDNKTYRGLLTGIVVSQLVFMLEIEIANNFQYLKSLSLIDYKLLPSYFGFLVGFGALIGDIVKSFFKRQLEIEPGKTWFPFDQVDWAVGSFVVTSFFVKLNIVDFLTFIGVGLLLHLVIKYLGALLGLSKSIFSLFP